MKAVLTIAAAALFTAATAHAQVPDFGAMTCADYVKAGGPGAEVKTGDAEADRELAALTGKLRDYCAGHPKANVRSAMEAIAGDD